MEKGSFVKMNCSHTTGCGKSYSKGDVGTVSREIGDTVYVRFPIHSSSDSSSIPLNKVTLVPENELEDAKKKFQKGLERYGRSY